MLTSKKIENRLILMKTWSDECVKIRGLLFMDHPISKDAYCGSLHSRTRRIRLAWNLDSCTRHRMFMSPVLAVYHWLSLADALRLDTTWTSRLSRNDFVLTGCIASLNTGLKCSFSFCTLTVVSKKQRLDAKDVGDVRFVIVPTRSASWIISIYRSQWSAR